jgi:hypothetical protein
MDENKRSDAPTPPAANGAVPDGLTIEGLRSPLTRGQRLRRAGIVAAVLLAALAILLWPTLGALPDALRSSRVIFPATATPSFSSHPLIEVTVIANFDSSACPTTPLTATQQGIELHADTIGNGDVWALLLMGPHIAASRDTKIVWRATGSGAFSVIAIDSDGTIASPQARPEPHPGGSNWAHPGDEWGTVFDFPQPGCWELSVTRGTSLTATIWLVVTP